MNPFRRSGRPTPDQRSVRRTSVAVGLATFVVFAAVGVAAVVAAVKGRDAPLSRDVDTVASSLEGGVDQTTLRLEAVDGLYQGSEVVTPEEFDAFARAIDPAGEPDSIVVARRVGGDDLDEFVDGFDGANPGTELTQLGPAGELEPLEPGRTEYYIAVFQHRAATAADVVGFDLASESTRRRAIVQAVRTDQTVVSEFVRLVGEEPDAEGFLVVVPVHDSSGEVVGVAVAATTVGTMIDTWVPGAVRDEFNITVSGAGNERAVGASWTRPVAKALVHLPDRTWTASISPRLPHWWLPAMVATLGLLALGMGAGAGTLTRTLLTRRSLTERLELSEALAQERQRRVEVLSDYELITANSTDLIIRQAPDLTYRYVSPSVRTILGYDPVALVGLQPWPSIHRDDVDALRESIQELVDGADIVDVEHRARHADGRWIWLHTVLRAIRGEDGTLVELQTSSRDVTEQVEQRDELIRSRTAIQRTSEEKALFLSTVSHEIRTPLTAVAGMSELLAETSLDPVQREYVETVQVAAHTVVSLVSDLLDLSKAEVGRLRLEAAPFDPKATVSEVVRVLEGQARAKGIALREEFGDVHGMVLGDAHRVRQILVNLAGNAIKFTSRGSVSIRVSQGDGDHPEPALLRFEVDDTGIGIPPDRLDAIFEDFEQVDASTTRLYGGTGLGLGISRHLVHLMGGVIGVDSSVGEGSMFWFEVPLPAVEAEEERTPARRVRVVGRPAERSHAASMLRSEGWLVDEADTLAHPSARSEPAVFVGPVDGLGRSIDLGSTVVVDTSPRRGNAERVRRRGAAAYVGAPASSEELETVLERVADGAPFLTRHDLSSPATSLRILAADDAPSNRLLVERTLSRRGHRVVSVGGGRDAIAAFESGEFDVVVLDGQMPDLSGVEVTRHIRARDAETGGHTPIVALTGRVGEEERAEVLAAGADLWVAKPFDVRRLHEVVEQAGGRLTPAQPAAGEAGVVLDLDVFRAQVAGLPEFAAELADTVRQEWAELEPAFRSESVRVDLEGTRAAAHRMRGVLGMVGAVEATAVATALEEAARSGDLRASLGFAGDLRASFTAVETALGEALFALAATRPE